jgi:biopolymer transport protein ExbD
MAQRLSGRFVAKPMASINMTPMVPVLLAVFVVVLTAGAVVEKPLDVVAPSCSLGMINFQAPYWVSVDGGGRYRFNGEPVSEAHLAAHLKALARESDERLMVRANPDVPYGEVAVVVNAVKAAGLSVQFINEDIS